VQIPEKLRAQAISQLMGVFGNSFTVDGISDTTPPERSLKNAEEHYDFALTKATHTWQSHLTWMTESYPDQVVRQLMSERWTEFYQDKFLPLLLQNFGFSEQIATEISEVLTKP
jgi:hypothetical protein